MNNYNKLIWAGIGGAIVAAIVIVMMQYKRRKLAAKAAAEPELPTAETPANEETIPTGEAETETETEELM